MTALVSAAFGEKKAQPSEPRPAPRIAGRFIEADPTRGLVQLHYVRNSRPETFTGFIHSACMLPPMSNSGKSKPLDLSTIPTGTSMTVFYVPHGRGKQPVNTILEVRFDRVQRGSSLPVGVNIPCYKAAGAPATKRGGNGLDGSVSMGKSLSR